MSSRSETLRLGDIVENTDAILKYVSTMSFDAFCADQMTVDATERCLSRITEAVIKIGEARMSVIAPDVPFHAVRGLGNALRHSYGDIDLLLIFATVEKRLPSLRAACLAALKESP